LEALKKVKGGDKDWLGNWALFGFFQKIRLFLEGITNLLGFPTYSFFREWG